MLKHRAFIAVMVAILLAAGAALATYMGHSTSRHAADSCMVQPPVATAAGEAATRRHIKARLKAGDLDPEFGRRIRYYHDPMMPGKKFLLPGKSPFMDMMLVPVYEDDGAESGGIQVSPRMQQNIGMRTAEVIEGKISAEFEFYGYVAFNETAQTVVQAKTNMYVERLHLRAPFEKVVKGQALAEISAPEWITAQDRYFGAKSTSNGDREPIIEIARQRMRQLGMSDIQIAEIEAQGRPKATFTIYSPAAGLLAEVGVNEGGMAMVGATMFRIKGMESLWVQADAPEDVASRVRIGDPVRISAASGGDRPFEGHVIAFISDTAQPARRPQLRIEVPNRDNKLLPGMAVRVRYPYTGAVKRMLVPSEAVIHTGKRALVMVAEKGGFFSAVQVNVGLEGGGLAEIVGGLRVGQRVVASAQFLIDSEASLRGFEGRQHAGADSEPALSRHRGFGTIFDIDCGYITVTHSRMLDIGLGAKVSKFRLGEGVLIPKWAKLGSAIEFEVTRSPLGEVRLVDMTQVGAEKSNN